MWDLNVGCQSCFCGYVVNKLCNYIETHVKRIMLLLLSNVYFYKKGVDLLCPFASSLIKIVVDTISVTRMG